MSGGDTTPGPSAGGRADDVRRLAGLLGLQFPEEDLAAIAAALEAHLAFVEPLLRYDVGDAPSALALDPRWRP